MKYRSDDEIEYAARGLRVRLGIDDQDRPDMLTALEKAKALGIIKDYVQIESLPNAEAKFDPQEEKIFGTRQFFAALANGDRRARFTLAHEFGHEEFDHTRTRYRSVLPRSITKRPVSFTEARDESDANRYAGAFLCPYHRAQYKLGTTLDWLATKFNVNRQVAEIRLPVLQRMYRQENRLLRPLPANVIDILRRFQGNGRKLKSLEDHERLYGELKEKTMKAISALIRNAVNLPWFAKERS
jgi:Zn-dependent peptidase ImmA (M78 family)